jgi:hypothetical protein
MNYSAKDLAKITGQTTTAIHAIARQMPLPVATPRSFSRIDALAITAARILRNRGLSPAVCSHVAGVLVREFKRIDEDPQYRPFMFAAPTPSRSWLTTVTKDYGEALFILESCPTAVYCNVAELMAEAEKELERHG